MSLPRLFVVHYHWSIALHQSDPGAYSCPLRGRGKEGSCRGVHQPAIQSQHRDLGGMSRCLLPLHLFPTFMWGRCWRYTPPCSTVIHIISRQSLLFDIIPHSVQPSSLRSSSLPSPLYSHYHCPNSYVVFLSSHHMPVPLQPSFLDSICDFPHFHCLFLSFLILSRFWGMSRCTALWRMVRFMAPI